MISSGALAQIRWGERGLELSTEAAVLTGLVLFGGVAAAVLSLTRRNERSGGIAGTDDADAEGETGTPEILTGDAVEDAEIALVRDERGDWTWRVVHLEALAERAAGAETRTAATDRVEHLQSVIESAGLREVPEAAIRLTADGDGDGNGDGDDNSDDAWRWTLVREDGQEVAAAATAYDDRDAAERAASLLKDHGPDADVVDLEGAAFTIAERDDRWVWQLVDDERTPLATGPDDYADRDAAEAAAERFAETVSDARVLDVETVGVELRSRADAALEDGTEDGTEGEDENGDGTEDADDGGDGTDTADTDGDETQVDDRWTWRLVDDADEVVARATVAFDDRPTAEAAATSVLEGLEDAAVTVADEPAYERYPASGTELGSGSASASESDAGSDLEPDADETGWQWRLTDASDRVVARAPAPFADRDGAKWATELFRETAPDADVLEIDGAVYEVHPADERAADLGTASGESEPPRSTAAEAATDASDSNEDGSIAASDGGTETVAASEGWRWRLVTEDRDVLATSPRAYADAETAATAIERARERARNADVTAFETAAFRVYEDETGEWRWRLLDAGGSVLADSDAAHDSRNEAIEAMLTLKERAPDAEVVEIDAAEFELFEADGGWSWRLIDGAGRLVAAASTTFRSRDAARAAVSSLRERLDASVHTMDRAVFQPVADGDADVWRWRCVLPSGEPLAASAGEYATRDELLERLSTIREAAATDRTHATGSVTVQLRGGDAWRWRLLDRDREPILESAGAYPDRDAARAAVDELERVGADASVFTIDDAAIRLERVRESGGEDGDGDGAEGAPRRWELVDGDRNVLATAARPEPRSDLEATIDDVRRLAPLAEPVVVSGASFDLVEESDETRGTESESGDADDTDADANWRWRLLDADGDPVAIASSAASSKVAAHEAIAEVRTMLENATVIELEDAVFELYPAAETGAESENGSEGGTGTGTGTGTENAATGDQAWAWRLLDAQGETLLESTRTYGSRTAAQRAIGTLQSQLPDGRVTVAD